MPSFSRTATKDAHAYSDGTFDSAIDTLGVGHTSASPDSYLAIEFTDIQVDRGSTINAASFLQSMSGLPSSDATYYAYLFAAISPTFPTTNAGLRGASLTTVKTDHVILTSAATGNRTWSILAALQEQVNKSTWVKGGSIVVLLKGASTTTRRSLHRSLENSSGSFAQVLTVDFTPPTISGSGAATAPQETASGSGSTTNTQASGSGSASAPEGTPSGSGSQGQVTASGSGSANAPEGASSGSGFMTFPPAEGTGSASAPSGEGAGSGTSDPVTASGSGSDVAPQGSASGSGTASQVGSTGAGGANAPEGAASGSGQATSGPVISGSGGVLAPGQEAVGTGVTPTDRNLFRPTRPKPERHIRLLNRSREVLAILDVSSPPTWSRKRNEATQISVTVPRGDIKLPYTQIASLIEVWEDDRRLVSGRISGRDVGSETVTISAMSEEILLEQHLTPANYSQVFANTDLADVVRRCLDSWHPLRVKAKETWLQRRVASTNADLDTAPSLVMIQRVNGRYVRSASITLRFQKSEVPRFKEWERIRWASDFADPVFTTIQYRYQINGLWSSWLPNHTVTVGTTSGQGERGVMTDAYGLYISAGTADILEVRCNLYTDDIDSGEEGETLGTTPIFYGLEVVARTHGHVAAGVIPSSAGVTVKSVEANSSTALAVVRAACEQCAWEFRIEGGKLNLAKAFGKNRTADFLLVG